MVRLITFLLSLKMTLAFNKLCRFFPRIIHCPEWKKERIESYNPTYILYFSYLPTLLSILLFCNCGPLQQGFGFLQSCRWSAQEGGLRRRMFHICFSRIPGTSILERVKGCHRARSPVKAVTKLEPAVHPMHTYSRAKDTRMWDTNMLAK